MNRLYAVEARYTLTGGMADHRLRVHTSQTLKVAINLAGKIADKTGDAGLKSAAAAVKLVGKYEPRSDYEAWIQAAADDLVEKKGASVVVAGSQHSTELHLLTIAINQALGAFGKVIQVKQTPVTGAATLAELATAAAAKQIDTLLSIGETDPLFEAPADIVPGGLAAALKNIPNFIAHTTRHRTATARAASWVVPATHFLEQWGDTRGVEGTYAIVQPMIAPLYTGSMSDVELLLALIANEPSAGQPPAAPPAPGFPEDPGAAFKAVRDTFNAAVPNASDAMWNNALRDGFAGGSAYPAVTAAPNSAAIATGVAACLYAMPR